MCKDKDQTQDLLYADHSMVAREHNWPAIERRIEGGPYRLVLSIWSLLEIATATDAGMLSTSDVLSSLDEGFDA